MSSQHHCVHVHVHVRARVQRASCQVTSRVAGSIVLTAHYYDFREYVKLRVSLGIALIREETFKEYKIENIYEI